jgi:hypothetical protein
MPAFDVPISSNRTYVDWAAEQRANRIAAPWLRGSQAAWEASRPAGWIRWVDVMPKIEVTPMSAILDARREARANRITPAKAPVDAALWRAAKGAKS